jgi:hypothetical protein
LGHERIYNTLSQTRVSEGHFEICELDLKFHTECVSEVCPRLAQD